ncbi:Bacterial extracellular solute-binding protein, family 5 Middle [Roseivivax sp. THAF40]|uniref:extracellular solute-binding protein n=1 Tax=unclassified Roseivivax TaxID=2639302 RepID=UPI001268DC2B|nr:MULTISPECIES: extracellular solute-binding protein [unclassified Roseivivax]QFS81578.1 Bacterial extracellular solute-binding protein, family 5 Middle [Roseivivax sp. THAF197b]QFT45307.1 Bacterial extracellular solute-binding protein, family 5 Middle [Roseivivax sp. THAF40]
MTSPLRPHPTRPAARAKARRIDRTGPLRALACLIALGVALAAATMARAESHETIVTSHGISSFGELKYGPDFAHWDYVNPDAPKGGTFSTWAFGTFDSLTPYTLKGNAAALSSIFYDTLMTGNLDEPDAMYGLVAESVEYPESREWAIFNMRPEAMFRDGTPVTADDVVFSYNILVTEGRPSYRIALKDFENVEALDTHRVKFTFNPDGPTRELLMSAAGLPILSRAYYEGRDFAESSLEPPMGSGEYTLKDVQPGRSVTYVRRDDYWGADLPVNVGQNNFDEIKIEYFADYTTAFEAFKGGAYLFREEYQSKIWATSYNFPAVEDGTVVVEQLPDGRPSGTQGFWFNLRRDKFQDPLVREAIGMAFNFEWSNESLFYGLYSRTDSFWENSETLQATGMAEGSELELLEPYRDVLPASVFEEEAFTPAVSSASDLADRRALRTAGRMLEEAGWEVGDDGFRYKDGERLTISVLNDSPSFDRIINPMIDNLKRLGIEADATRVDSAEAQEREKTFDYDIVTQRFAMSSTPGDELRGIFGSETANVEGSNNVPGLQNEAVDGLIDTIAKAETREELTVAVRALDRVLRSLHIWVPQWYNPTHNIAYFDVFERPYDDEPPRYGMGELGIWWYSEEKAEALRAAGKL